MNGASVFCNSAATLTKDAAVILLFYRASCMEKLNPSQFSCEQDCAVSRLGRTDSVGLTGVAIGLLLSLAGGRLGA
jgi:hypothetical protein